MIIRAWSRFLKKLKYLASPGRKKREFVQMRSENMMIGEKYVMGKN